MLSTSKTNTHFSSILERTHFSLKNMRETKTLRAFSLPAVLWLYNHPKSRSLGWIRLDASWKPSKTAQKKFWTKNSKIFIFWKSPQKRLFLTFFYDLLKISLNHVFRVTNPSNAKVCAFITLNPTCALQTHSEKNFTANGVRWEIVEM